ncbi:MAG: hypothetical protein ABIH23_18120 [bacterium]
MGREIHTRPPISRADCDGRAGDPDGRPSQLFPDAPAYCLEYKPRISPVRRFLALACGWESGEWMFSAPRLPDGQRRSFSNGVMVIAIHWRGRWLCCGKFMLPSLPVGNGG